MASKSGGIGIGTLIFWAIMAYSFFGGDDDKTEVEVKVNDKPAIVEQKKEPLITEKDKELLKDGINTLKAKVEQITIEAKEILVETKDGLKPLDEVVKEETKSNDIYGNPDDVYGDTKDKF